MRKRMVLALCLLIAALPPLAGCGTPAAQPVSPTPPPGETDTNGVTGETAVEQQFQITSLEPYATHVHPGDHVSISSGVSNPRAEPLRYDWTATGGSFNTAQGSSSMTWVAPDRTGDWTITLTVHNNTGDAVARSIAISVADNHPPIISQLTAAALAVPAAGSTTVTCVASDPENDPLSYAWRADGGDITGIGPTVTWFAPDKWTSQQQEFTITVTVSDGKGGQDLRQTVLRSQPSPSTTAEVLVPVAHESRTIRSDGAALADIARAGDDEQNRGYRAFWSFDLSDLRGASVSSATLEFGTGAVVASHDLDESGFAEQGPSSKLWTQLNGLRIYQVRYLPDGLPQYDPERTSELTQAALFEAPTRIDVTNLVKAYAAADEAERLQVMAAFQRDTNPNMFAEYITWTSVRLAIVYAPD
jgi:hypothetical protein